MICWYDRIEQFIIQWQRFLYIHWFLNNQFNSSPSNVRFIYLSWNLTKVQSNFLPKTDLSPALIWLKDMGKSILPFKIAMKYQKPWNNEIEVFRNYLKNDLMWVKFLASNSWTPWSGNKKGPLFGLPTDWTLFRRGSLPPLLV